MSENINAMLAVGGKSNSLGKVNEVIEIVLHDKSRLNDVYSCLFHEDAWVRMRAADTLEKICREHPDWLSPYVDNFLNKLATTRQPSIQWHLAQMYREIALTPKQKQRVTEWLEQLISTTEVDWIVAANAMATLVQFTKDGSFPAAKMISLLKIQQKHASKSVVRRASKLFADVHNMLQTDVK